MLQDRYPIDRLEATLLPLGEWRPFPPASDRKAWEALLKHPLNRERKAHLVSHAQALCGRPWPDLPATLFLDIMRTGSRANYETPYFARRQHLGVLVLAECFEHNGRFIDEIANGLWAIAQEPTWVLPAHTRPVTKPADPDQPDVLPHPEAFTVDLFAAETAMVLAETLYLLRADLEQFSSALVAYVQDRVLKQVIEPIETRDDFGGWWKSHANWNTWCSSNVFGAAMFVVADPARLARFTHRVMGFVDTFLEGQPADGGCTEGPGYWGVAAGALLVFLELLHSRTQGAVDIYSEPLVAELGRYISRVHLDGRWMANFADCPAGTGIRRAVVYQYGKRIEDEGMREMTLLAMRGWSADGEVSPLLQQGMCGGDINHMLREIFWIPADATPTALLKQEHVWLPDIQVMVARESETPRQGLVVAAKAGHNGEKHNHNDVGQFILLHSGRPVIVDVGVERYTRATFRSGRYKMWCIRGAGHNAPVVSGREQPYGREFAASNVTCTSSEAESRLGMNLEKAYEDDSGLVELRRDIRLQRGANARLSVTDTYRLAEAPGSIVLNLYSPCTCRVGPAGTIELDGADLVLQIDPEVVAVEIKTRPVTDERMLAAWGPQLTHLVLSHTAKEMSGTYGLTFRRQ